MAVGLQGPSDFKPLTEKWNGTAWSKVSSPSSPNGTDNYLNAISCASSKDCFAVGYYVTPNGWANTLVEHWNGTSWTITPSPNATETDQGESELYGVSCTSPTDCFAVGHWVGLDAPYYTLIEHWDGAAWTIVSSPTPDPNGDFLNAVSCVSAVNCVAVGYSTHYRTFVEKWDGMSWSTVTSPNSGTDTNELLAVGCSANGSCEAVGWRATAVGSNTLVEQWNGTSWSVVSSSGPTGETAATLVGVSCASSVSCFAVGQWNSSSGQGKTLLEQWDGVRWSIVTSPNAAGSSTSELAGVSCTQGPNCEAVGQSNLSGGAAEPLAEGLPVVKVPGAPTGVKAAAQNTPFGTGSLKVSFTAPGSSGGITITRFTASCASTNGGVTNTATHTGPTAAAITVSGLTTGQTYACTVTAANAVGTGPPSAASLRVIVGSPAPPKNVVAKSGSTTTETGTVQVTFALGASNGSAITSQIAACTPTGGGLTQVGVHLGATAAAITITGLITGDNYTCWVRVTNGRGTGLASAASLPVIVGSPALPTGVTAVRVAAGQIKVSFAIGANNGSAITSQTATCTSTNGGVTKTGIHAGATAAPITVIGLTTTKSYTCTVKATNVRGAGLSSARSPAVVV